MTAPVPLAREHHARVLVLDGHGDVGVALVVAEADVERRPVALDQVLLEMERLDLGRGDDHLDLLDALDQPVEPEPGVAAAEVRAHAGPERLRLADVERRPPSRRGTGRRPASPGAPSAAPRCAPRGSSRLGLPCPGQPSQAPRSPPPPTACVSPAQRPPLRSARPEPGARGTKRSRAAVPASLGTLKRAFRYGCCAPSGLGRGSTRRRVGETQLRPA